MMGGTEAPLGAARPSTKDWDDPGMTVGWNRSEGDGADPPTYLAPGTYLGRCLGRSYIPRDVRGGG